MYESIHIANTRITQLLPSALHRSLCLSLSTLQWHRTPKTNETDGFQVKRAGDQNVKCTVMLLLDYNPLKYKLDPRLSRLLGFHTETRPEIINGLWQYIKQHRLQDPNEREFINCDKFLAQVGSYCMSHCHYCCFILLGILLR